ncbi:phage tail length tape measure family protein [Sphingobium sp. S6]|uniref:phage tail length tape measure family protein n=1 Tax=Sphingobium sp. S6 TaxID=2758386 RepID=UPI00191A8A89|nr:phage tail length tape measure family protein [Sphingobium sp. S6]
MRRAEKAVGDMARVVMGSSTAAGNSLTKFGQTAGVSANQFSRGMVQVSRSTGEMRAGMQQLSYQIGDVAQQFAVGTNPMVIFAQQGQQVVQALAMMRGSATGLIGFLAGPWGAALMGAGMVLGLLIPKLMETSQEMENVRFASGAVGDAQSILGGVLDLTTGKINNQSGALMALARAQLAVARVQAKTRQAEAKNSIQGAGKLGFFESFGHIFDSGKAVAGRGITQDIMKSLLAGATTSKAAITTLENLNKEGMITDAAFTKAASAVANFAVEGENLKTYDSAQRILDGVGTSLDRNLILKPAKAARAVKAAISEAQKAWQDFIRWLDDSVAAAPGNIWNLAQEMDKRNQEWGKGQATVGEKMIQDAKDLEALTDAQMEGQRQLLDIYLQQLDAIGRMGGAFSPLAGMLTGLKTGNFAGVGGKIGGLLSLPTGSTTKDVDGRVIAETLGDKLKDIFSKNGEFFAGLSAVLANAALGSTAAGLAGGSKLGGGIGGAIGGFLTGKNGPFGKALESGLNSVFQGLGSFAGPLGSIAGGLLGGALGGLFKPKPKYASAGLFMNEYGELAGGTAKGNAGSAIRAASGIASNVADGLNSLAEQLGAKITGVPNIKVGTYDGKYRVNVEGRGGKMDFKGNSAKGLYNFGDDEQAAIEFAIQKSIEGAVLTGISQASINILKSGQDLQKAIEKATLIEDIPRELQRRLDPVGYAIDELNKKWMRTVDALREGGATAQQMADAQKLYNLELGEAKDNAGEASRAMKDFLNAMNMGSSSPLSLRDQAANAKSALDPFLAQIHAGQAVNQDKYLEAAQTYLDIERQMYGSTAKYFEAFDQIQAATNKAIAAVDNAAPIRTTADPFIEATATATKSMEANTANMVTLQQENNALQKENNALLQKVAAKGETWSGSLRNYGS